MSPAAIAQRSSIDYSLTAATTYTDVSGRAGDSADGQLVSSISPSISWSSQAGRVQGAARYSVVARFFSQSTRADNFRQALSANVRAEAIENWLFVDATASISQQAISPFGLQSTDDSAIDNENQTEVRSLTVSPYILGSLYGLANYQVRFSASYSGAGGLLSSDSSTQTTTATLSSPSSRAVFGWTASATRRDSQYDSGVDSTSERVSAGVTANLDVIDLRLGLTAGRESADVADQRRNIDTWGWNLLWTPTPRTSAAVSSQRRYFGNSHRVALTHRMRRSSLTYTDTRSEQTSVTPLTFGRPITLFELYFELFAPQEPDPARRELLVREFLRAAGLDPAAIVSVGFITSSATVQRRQDLLLGMQWLRTTLNLRAFRTQTSRLQQGAFGLLGGEITQTGYTASLSRRLTPTSSVSVTGSRLSTSSDGVRAGTGLNSATASYSNRFSRDVTGSLSLRRTVFKSQFNPYRESAATASVSMQF